MGKHIIYLKNLSVELYYYSQSGRMDPSLVSTIEEQQDGTYLNVAFVSVWIWELLTSLAEERVLLLEHRVTFPQIVYIVARVSSIICVTTASVLSAEDYTKQKSWIDKLSSPVPDPEIQPYYASHCSDEMEFLGWIFVISTATNSLLMFFRVRAVFSHSKPTVIAFGLLWAATLGGALTIPISVMTAITQMHADTDASYLGCEYIVFPAYVFSAYLISAVYDALLFLAVTYRLLFYHLYRGDGQTSRLKSFFSGEGLGHVSKADCGDEHIEHDQHIFPNIPSWSWHHRFHGALRSRDEYHGLHGLQAAEARNIAERPLGPE
ncbi:hypothetical protein PHLCEN_2v5596 [Hermanssonia centrifuga]|uniref:Uncharacterized protein n=1 Tax=Hermanssonia centrifuga TaxID=98765 RepID=A0A2R6P209_9APHY|nr:hypothetical protein PHLCEN_2v5596 [Hermanssonia centrifuga]